MVLPDPDMPVIITHCDLFDSMIAVKASLPENYMTIVTKHCAFNELIFRTLRLYK